MTKELTILEKAHKVIESGLFAEDFVMCPDEFINGAYTMLEAQVKAVEDEKGDD